MGLTPLYLNGKLGKRTDKEQRCWPPPWATAATAAGTTPGDEDWIMCPAGSNGSCPKSLKKTGTKGHLCESGESECLSKP